MMTLCWEHIEVRQRGRLHRLASFLPTVVTGTGCCLSKQVEKSYHSLGCS